MQKRWVSLLLACLLVVGPLGSVPAHARKTTTVPGHTNTNRDRLQDALNTARTDQSVDVIVRLHADRVAASTAVTKARVQWRRALNGYAARLKPAQIAALLRDPGVAQVEADLPVRTLLDSATRWTGVTQARRDFGITGDGDGDPARYSRDDPVIAVIDTGIDARHVDLAGGKVIGWHDAVGGKAEPYDDNGHGTHVSSIAAGSGRGGTPGVAPGAALVGIKVLDGQGGGRVSDILSGIEWLLENQERYGIRIANLSLGAAGCADGSDALSQAVNKAAAAGIAMLVAAGNAGFGSCTVGAPAAAARAITVGAAADPGEGGWSVALFSSRGPTRDGRIKPDLLAPGVNIAAAAAGTSRGYVAHSGTSMAAPFAAGVAALMLSAKPSLKPAEIKAALTATANTRDYGRTGPDPEYGRGILEPYALLKRITGKSGTFTTGLQVTRAGGNLTAARPKRTVNFRVENAKLPVAVTLIVPGRESGTPGAPAFALAVIDPNGKEVVRSARWLRQEQVRFTPGKVGVYQVRVAAHAGTGAFTLDISHG